MGALLTLAVGLVVGALVGVLLTRRAVSRRLGRVLRSVGAEPLDPAEVSLDSTMERLEKALAKEQGATASTRAALDRLRLVLDALPVGVVVADERGTIVIRNDLASHFLGVRHADVLVDEAVGSLLRTGFAGEYRRQTLELYGPPKRTVVVSAVPVEGDNGVRAALATIEDVTERSRLEAMRTDFVANISHELKTPVGALALLAEALVGEDEPDVVNRLAEKMVIEAHRVARIIEDLLELSQIEVGSQPHRDLVSVGLIAAEAVDRVRPLAERRGIKVAVHEPSRRLNAVGDRRQLVSAVANLVENGVKYSDPGAVVEVMARTDGAWVDIEVRDHGIGIPTPDLDRVFERFYRVDRARSRETGGTGLGLAIVRHVATNHGGNVSVVSREGFGSTFTLHIPAGPGPVSVTTEPREEAG